MSRELQRQLEQEELPNFQVGVWVLGEGSGLTSNPLRQFVEINAMALTKPQQAYVELWRAVSDKQVSAARTCMKRQWTHPPSLRTQP